MLSKHKLLLLSLLVLELFAPLTTTNAQQNYSGNSALDCEVEDSTGPNPAFLYTCNGQSNTCKAFLIFKAQPSFDSVPAIASLTSSDLKEVAAINDVAMLAKFPDTKEVIVPVDCSCLGKYYQSNTTFQVTSDFHTYYSVAQDTFEGLSTCVSLLRENAYGKFDLGNGMELRVPLRCACPTRRQIARGTRYMLTYPVSSRDAIPGIAERFNVSVKSIVEANGLDLNLDIYPDTTILIPLPGQPTSSMTIIHDLPPPRLSPSPLSNQGSKRKLYKIAGIAAGCSILLLGAILFVILQLSRRRNAFMGNRGKNKKKLSKDLLVEIASFEKVLKLYNIEEVKKATNNFSPLKRIKGSVYSGNFGGEVLAVKRVSRDVSKEINILKNTNHFNLIKLHGVCESPGCFFLLFEYMENGSLREWLTNQSCKEKGSWRTRVQIALDIANGLHYLHSFTKPAHVHMDIRSSNVLLTSDLRAKVSNFGHARAAERQATEASQTHQVTGTLGYMAPEYVALGDFTLKIDVYAFGVVLLELITGRDVVFKRDGKDVLLSVIVITTLEKENAEAELAYLIDDSLRKGNHEKEIAIGLAKLSVACLSKDPGRRPSMEEAVSTLMKIQADLPVSELTIIDVVADGVPFWRPLPREPDYKDQSVSVSF